MRDKNPEVINAVLGSFKKMGHCKHYEVLGVDLIRAFNIKKERERKAKECSLLKDGSRKLSNSVQGRIFFFPLEIWEKAKKFVKLYFFIKRG